MPLRQVFLLSLCAASAAVRSARAARSLRAGDEGVLEGVLAADAGAQAARAWEHPGVLVSSKQLSSVRAALASREEPFASVHAKASSSRFAKLNWEPLGPPASGTIECGFYDRPNRGCSDEAEDAIAAYTHARLFALDGDAAHARAAARIMDAYAGLKGYSNDNAPLQAAWSASKWSRAAELVVHADGGGAAVWPRKSADAFRAMLRRAALPLIANSNGNWALSMIEGMLGIAVLTEDEKLFSRAADFWRTRVPAYVYVSADGKEPVDRPNRPGGQGPANGNGWYGQKTFDGRVEGISQETCRDLEHTQMGLAAALNAAETARIQGVDLFDEEAPRLVAGLEFHARLLLGEKTPAYVCGGSVNDANTHPMFELGFTRLHDKKKAPMTMTKKLIVENVRKLTKLYNGFMVVWETLVHATAFD